jgi:hypothetical protein
VSNYWDLYCRTCGEIHDLDWNHGGERIQSMIPLLPELVKIGPILDRLEEYFYDLRYPSGLLHFAKQHNGHDLIARDEYGKLFDACGEYYRCPCCDHPSHCKLPLKHEGDHGQLPKEAVQ